MLSWLGRVPPAGWFLLTTLSVWGVYVVDHGGTAGGALAAVAWDGLVFALSLMSILLAHEMGHYLVARAHGFSTSPPAFIPLPLPGTFGTMGAVIRLRSLPRSRQALLEMGAAGPIAGAVVAFALLWYAVPLTLPAPDFTPGATVAIFNDPLVVKLIGVLRTGAPPDRYGVYHPAAEAAWVGCLLTAVNLVPLGQLDGGHVFNGLFPRLTRAVRWVLLPLAVIGAYFYPGWLVWAVVVSLLGAARALPVPEDPPPPLRSRLVALVILGLFVLTFTPVPVEIETLPGGPAPGEADPPAEGAPPAGAADPGGATPAAPQAAPG